MSSFSAQLSRVRLLATGLASMVNGMQFWILLPVGPTLVAWQFPDIDSRDVGFYSGYYSSAFAVGMIFARPSWQLISNRLGQRPTLIIGLLCSALFILFFSFSHVFWVTVLARFLSGVACGCTGVYRDMYDILAGDNSVENINRRIVISNGGRLLGPLLGGVLLCPSATCSVFDVDILTAFPFSLPACVYAFIAIVIAFLVRVVLEESSPGGHNGEYQKVQLEAEPLDNFELTRESGTDAVADGGDGTSPLHELTTADLEMAGESWEEGESGGGLGDIGPNMTFCNSFGENGIFRNTTGKQRVSFNAKVLVKVIDCQELSLGDLRQVSPSDEPVEARSETTADGTRACAGMVLDGSIWDHTGKKHSSLKKSTANSNSRYPDHVNLSSHENNGGVLRSISPSSADERIVRYSTGSEFSEGDFDVAVVDNAIRLLGNKNILLCCVLHGILGFINATLLEVFPLWLALPTEYGGLGVHPLSIGFCFSCSYVIFLIVRLRVFEWMVASMPLKAIFQLGVIMLLFGAVVCAIMSMTFRTTEPTWGGFWIANMFIFLGMLAGIQISQCVLNKFTSNACYTHERLTVFTIANGCVAIVKVVGPLLTSVIFAAGQRSQLRYPFNASIVWNVLTVASLLAFVLSTHFTRKIIRSRREPVVPRYAVTMSPSNRNLGKFGENLAGLADIDGTIEMSALL